MRKIKEKFNCVYCGHSTSTFCGYWKMISVGSYDPNNKKVKSVFIDNCYAHIGCYLKKHNKLLMCGVVPLCVNNEVYDRPKQVAEMMRIHNIKPSTLKNKIVFLKKVIKSYEAKR